MLYFVSVVYSFPSLNHIPLCGWTTFGWWTTLGCFYLVLLDSATVNVPVQAFVRADWCFRRPALGAVRGAQLGLEVRRRASCLASLSPSSSSPQPVLSHCLASEAGLRTCFLSALSCLWTF